MPYVSVALTGGLRTGAVPPGGVPDLGPWFNRAAWSFGAWAMNLYLRGELNRFRARYGARPVRDVLTEGFASRRLNLIATSPTLYPPQPEWPDQHKVCGVMDVPPPAEDEALSEAVERFLVAGEPPVYFHFWQHTHGRAAARVGRRERCGDGRSRRAFASAGHRTSAVEQAREPFCLSVHARTRPAARAYRALAGLRPMCARRASRRGRHHASDAACRQAVGRGASCDRPTLLGGLAASPGSRAEAPQSPRPIRGAALGPRPTSTCEA